VLVTAAAAAVSRPWACLLASRSGRRFKGVRRRKWGRFICEVRDAAGKRIWLGSYDSEEGAARVYDAAARVLQGTSAWLNFPFRSPRAHTPGDGGYAPGAPHQSGGPPQGWEPSGSGTGWGRPCRQHSQGLPGKHRGYTQEGTGGSGRHRQGTAGDKLLCTQEGTGGGPKMRLWLCQAVVKVQGPALGGAVYRVRTDIA